MSQNDSSTMTANMISRKPYTPRGVSTVWEGVEISPFYVVIRRKDLFALQIFPLHLIEQGCLAAVSDVVQNCFRGNGALPVFQEP